MDGDHRRRCRAVIDRRNAFMSLTTVVRFEGVPVAVWPVTNQKRAGTMRSCLPIVGVDCPLINA